MRATSRTTRSLIAALAVAAMLTALAVCAGCSKDSPETPEPTLAGGPLSGTIELPGGNAAAGANVVATGIGFAAPVPVFSTTTDLSGQFSIQSVPTGAYRVCAFVPPDTGGAVTANVPTNPVTIHLAAPAYARGVASRSDVTDQRGIFIASDFPFGVGVTDSVGAYVRWLPPGHWQVFGFVPGYNSSVSTIDVVTPGDTISVPPITLTPGRGP
jgi:hypothetical protein